MIRDPLIGKTIGNYHIERMIGRGGMAQVYYGQDVKLQRPVAIKFIDQRYRGNTAQARRFIKEARVMAKWRHENIIQIYSADDQGELYFYVMEYVDGKDLSSILSSYHSDGELLPIPDVIRIGRAIANALDYAHSQKVIHRDVKPSNVLVAKDGRVMLSDFGLALDLADGSQGEAFGTAHYIPPEQARSSANAVPQSDLYSLGIILYEMLTGVVPFSDSSPATVALQHISKPLPPPRSKNPDLSAETEAVLIKALEKEPGKRFTTGAQLMDALEKALTQPRSAAAMSLPPLPVGVPTIRRPVVSQNAVADRVADRPTKKDDATVRSSGTMYRELSNRASAKRLRWIWFVLLGSLLLLSLAGIWYFRDSIFRHLPAQAEPTFTAAPPLPTDLPASATPTDIPSSPTATDLPTATATVTVAMTATELPATSEPSVTPIPVTATPPAIKYPNGDLFLLLYNQNSFFILNRSRVTRSISGFTFERLDEQGNSLEAFFGWRWEEYFRNLAPNRCMALLVVDNPPYLEPVECGRVYSSVINLEREDKAIFWTTLDTSHQFRVLWMNEEVARCETETGLCEVRTP